MKPQYHQSCLNESRPVFFLKICTHLCALYILLSLPFRVIFLSQSLPPPPLLFNQVFFVCLVMHLLAFSLSHTKSQSIINSYSLSQSLPLSFLPRSGLFMLPYILSITLQQITHATPLCNFRLLINQSARVLASLTLKRLKSTLHFISFAYT